MKLPPLWVFCFLLFVLIRGSGFSAIEIAVAAVPPFSLVALRSGTAFVLFLAVAGLRAYFKPEHSHKAFSQLTWKAFWLGSGLGFFDVTIPFVLAAAAETLVDGGITAILLSLAPIFVLLWRVVLWRTFEGITWWHLLGVILGIVGVTIVYFRTSLGPLLHGTTLAVQNVNWLANGILLIASIVTAFGLLYTAHFFKGFDTLFLALLQSWWSLVFTGLGSLIFEFPPWPWSWAKSPYYGFFLDLNLLALGSVLYLSFVSTWVRFFLYFYLLETIGPIQLSFANFLTPLVASVETILFLGAWRHVSFAYKTFEVIGGFLIVVGVLVVQATNAAIARDDTHDRERSSDPPSTAVSRSVLSSSVFDNGLSTDQSDDSHTQALLPGTKE